MDNPFSTFDSKYDFPTKPIECEVIGVDSSNTPSYEAKLVGVIDQFGNRSIEILFIRKYTNPPTPESCS